MVQLCSNGYPAMDLNSLLCLDMGRCVVKHSISPYPDYVCIKPICDGAQVFQHEHYRGTVEKVENWGTQWLARPEQGTPRFFKGKVEAVQYLLIDEEE